LLMNNSIFALLFSGCSVARLSRLLWEQEAAGSNPATPTKRLSVDSLFSFHEILYYFLFKYYIY